MSELSTLLGTTGALPSRPEGAGELEEALRVVPGVLERLRRGYAEIEARAERVERELVLTNAELERKVDQLDALKRHLEAVLESLPNGVIERDPQGRIVRVNAAVQRILGLPTGELVGRREHPHLPEPAADGQPREVARADGERLVLASHYASVLRADGTAAGSVEILDDRTEASTLTERLHAADKMAALGTLTAGVAHEIRNPLNAVRGFADLLRKTLRESAVDARLCSWADCIVSGAGEMDAIVENMLTFGSPERLRLETIDPAELLREALEAARTGEDLHDDFTVELRCDAPSFGGDRLKLRQALRNLIENGLGVQGAGARLVVRASLEGSEIVLSVADAGPGIPAELAARVFDPFFTTRADGTGLGLALVATIARLHGGRAEVSPVPSLLGGAEVFLRLPHPSARGPESSSCHRQETEQS